MKTSFALLIAFVATCNLPAGASAADKTSDPHYFGTKSPFRVESGKPQPAAPTATPEATPAAAVSGTASPGNTAATGEAGHQVGKTKPQAVAGGNYPIVGKWAWVRGGTAVFDANGTSCTFGNLMGTWEFEQDSGSEQRYRLNWANGRFINTMTISADGRSAVLVDLTDNNSSFKARKFTNQKNPDAIGQILGRWVWGRLGTTYFDADGTCDNKGCKGTWKFLNNPELEPKYRVNWSNGSINTMTIARDGRTAVVVDQTAKNARFNARRLGNDEVTK
jgi:hypothetical protein